LGAIGEIPTAARVPNYAGYAFMAVSMLLFVLAGLWT